LATLQIVVVVSYKGLGDVVMDIEKRGVIDSRNDRSTELSR